MKRLALATVLVVCACVEAQETPSLDRAALEGEVGTFLTAYRAAADAPDTAALRLMYVDDGRFAWVEDGEVRYDSPSAVISALSSLPPDFPVETAYDRTTIALIGDEAAAVSMHFVTSMGEGATAFQFGGMITLVVERGPFGWQIVSGHTSTPRPDGR